MQLINELRYNTSDFNNLQEGDLIVVLDGYINVINSNDGNDPVALNILRKLCKTFTEMTPNIFNNDGTLRSLFERDIKDAILQFEGFPKLLIGEVFNDENNEFILSIDNDSYDVYHSKELHYLVKSGLLNNKFNSIYINDVKYPINKFGNEKDKSMDGIPIANPMYHGTCEAFLYSILTKGLRKIQGHSAFSVDNDGFVFLTSDYKTAFYYAKMYERETKSNQVIIEIDTSQIDKNKIVLDYDFAYSFATPGDKNPFNKDKIGDYYNYKGPVVTTSKNYGSKFGKIGYKGVIMPNAIKKIYVYDKSKQIHQFTREEYINYYKKNYMNENLLREWYYPDNFQELPDKITLYHGTDYFSLEEILSSGIVDAYNGRSTGETKGMNWFSTKYSTNFSRGFVFSIEVNKNEIGGRNNGFRYMNDGEIANYEPIDIRNRNIKICEAFDYEYQDLIRMWNIQLKKANNNIEDAFFNFTGFLRKYYEDWDEDAFSSVIIQLMKQFNAIDGLKSANIIENKINEVDSKDINLKSFEPQTELHPKIWVNNKLNSRIRLRLLDIADDFIDTLAVDWVKPEDVVFTGSLANYNWSKHSDIDIHIMMDYSKVYKKREFVEDYFNAKKETWLENHPDLKIYGFPVELYVEDTNGDSVSTGIYSLNKNKWIKEPNDFQDVKLNEKYIKRYASELMTQIDDLIQKHKKEKDEHKLETISNKLKSIFDKIKKLRLEGLSKKGEMSSGNIIYKIIKRSDYFDKLWEIVNKSYDKINSIK